MIQINNLTCQFGEKLILDNVTLKLTDNQIYYLSGPMGSGKSLFLKVIATENQINHDYTKFSCCYIGDKRLIFNDISVKDNLYFYQKLFKTSKISCDEIIKYFNFEVNLGKKVSELSEGNKQLLYLICLLMNNQVNVYLLDEPFVNLDQATTNKLVKYLKTVIKNAIIIYTSHTYDNHELYDVHLKIINKRIEVQ